MASLQRSVTLSIALHAVVAVLSAQAPNPRFGTWKLDPAKSTYVAVATPAARTVTIEPAGDGEKTSSETVLPDGSRRSTSFTASYDGKDYPVTGSPTADTVSLKRIDASTIERTDKKGGQILATFRIAVAPDGKTMTVTANGASQGQTWSLAEVYERQ